MLLSMTKMIWQPPTILMARNKGWPAVNDCQILHLDHQKSLICDQGDCPIFCNESCTQVNSDHWWKITYVAVYKLLIRCLQNNFFLTYISCVYKINHIYFMSLNFVISSLAYLAYSPTHQCRLRQSGGEHTLESSNPFN